MATFSKIADLSNGATVGIVRKAKHQSRVCALAGGSGTWLVKTVELLNIRDRDSVAVPAVLPQPTPQTLPKPPAAPVAKAKGSLPRIITRHDYISLDFGYGRRFTRSWSGAKGTNIPSEAFEAMDRYCSDEANGSNVGERFAKLVVDIDQVWSSWATPPQSFKIGDRVATGSGKRRMTGTICGELKRGNVVFLCDDGKGTVRVSPFLLECI